AFGGWKEKGSLGGSWSPGSPKTTREVGMLFHPPHRSRDRREGWGAFGGSPLTLAALGMERKGGAWGLRRSQDDPGIQAFFPHPPEGWLEEGHFSGKTLGAVAQKSPCEEIRVIMGKEPSLKLSQRGRDARAEVPMRTPKRLYAAERIIYHPE